MLGAASKLLVLAALLMPASASALEIESRSYEPAVRSGGQGLTAETGVREIASTPAARIQRSSLAPENRVRGSKPLAVSSVRVEGLSRLGTRRGKWRFTSMQALELSNWLSADPLFLQTPTKSLESPLEMNLYSYALNNPAVFVDSDGLTAGLPQLPGGGARGIPLRGGRHGPRMPRANQVRGGRTGSTPSSPYHRAPTTQEKIRANAVRLQVNSWRLERRVNGLVDRALGRTSKWTVDPQMRSVDKAMGIVVNDSYVRNPTARRLDSLMTPTGKIGGKRMSGRFMYVIDEGGNITIGTRAGEGRMPHPTLVGGKDPTVTAAGMVDIRGGRIYSIDNGSGHFKPGRGSLETAEKAFGKLPDAAFHKDFQGYQSYDKK